MSAKAGLYIHIPFCIKKCNYCAFLSVSGSDAWERESYVEALIREIEIRSDEIGVCDSIYFGGGTPSLLNPEQISRIINACYVNFDVENEAEITMEVNPATVRSVEAFWQYKDAGVNRLSIGVQSFNDNTLARLGRIHSSHQVYEEFGMARRAGFDNIGLDLMFSVPGTALPDVVEDVRALIALSPEHVSFYSLELETGTPFYKQFEAGALEEIPDDIDREMFHMGISLLRDAGYEYYEISNFCKPGYKAVHNSKYWCMAEYCGFGLGASSWTCGKRSINFSSFDRYFDVINRGKPPFETQYTNTIEDNISEAVFTGLRRSQGVIFSDLAEISDGIIKDRESFIEYFSGEATEILEFCESGDLVITGHGIRLTEKGIDISNRIMALFV